MEEAKESPQSDPLARQWARRIKSARSHWEKFHNRVRHNRKVVAGFDWKEDIKSDGFYKRANLIHGAINSILPQIYARNPEISAVPARKGDNNKLFCETLEKVVNTEMEKADLKQRAKMSVRAALTCSFGVVKVMYQRDYRTDPHIHARIKDTQDNIARIEHLLAEIDDPARRGDEEAKLAELKQTMASLEEQSEVLAAEGLVIDRVMTDHLLVDPSVIEFWDYPNAEWIAQLVPMSRSTAEAKYGKKLDNAIAYKEQMLNPQTGKLASGEIQTDDDPQIVVIEIWDSASQSVYTMADGCDFWLTDPYRPKSVGARWYPFFLLPYQVVDGQFVAPSVVDLMEKLEREHNDVRDKFNKHRALAQPGWIASKEIDEKSLHNVTNHSSLGEVTLVDTNGGPLGQVIMPRQHPPVDPAVYDTNQIRYDIEQVIGLQDAMRSTVVKPKTATEASIMQQSLSGRISEFRDMVEDWLQSIAQYAAQILLQELTPQQVERITGPNVLGQMGEIIEKTYDWPQLDKEAVFDLVEMRIRAGTTGEPDKLEQQESWIKVLPIVQQLTAQIMQVQAQGGDADPFINILRETLARFDERMDVEMFIPKPPQMSQLPQPTM